MTQVCLLPGWGFSPAVFSALLSRLPRQWRVTAPALEATAGESLESWAHRLAPLIPEGAVLIGWSLGAQLALALAAQGTKASALVAIAASPRFTASDDWPAGLAPATVEQFRSGWEHQRQKTRKRFLALQVLGEAQRSELLAELEQARLPEDAPGQTDALRILAESDLRPQVGQISTPTLLIHGEADALMPPAASAWLAGRIPGARRLVLPACAHAPHVAQPEAVADAILAWLATLPTDARAERRSIRAAFDAAADHYDAAAGLQREVASALAESASFEAGAQGIALDAGCGTGFGLDLLARRAPRMTRLGLDLAPAMARASQDRGTDTLAADIEALPLADGSIDRYWSSLAWQWCDAALAAREAFRVLAPGGILSVATLGPETLAEVRAAFATIDTKPHVRRFASEEALRAALTQAGFTDIEIARRAHFAWAPDLRTLLHAIRAIGAHTLGEARRRGLMGRSAWKQLNTHYERYRRAEGLPARYDVLQIHARKTR
ncbi:alpha/beta fold hydrolase [Niveibacterium terrae]|uniref:alpha/beta fold hydrolase n=1 Tax=Niveibacterium terrae TaxID=3373598 RepID=UPI003A9395DC